MIRAPILSADRYPSHRHSAPLPGYSAPARLRPIQQDGVDPYVPVEQLGGIRKSCGPADRGCDLGSKSETDISVDRKSNADDDFRRAYGRNPRQSTGERYVEANRITERVMRAFDHLLYERWAARHPIDAARRQLEQTPTETPASPMSFDEPSNGRLSATPFVRHDFRD